MRPSVKLVIADVLKIACGIRRLLLSLAGVCALLIPLTAHDIITTQLTYTRDISRICARRCVACHGERSSIPLTSYQQVRPWAVDIKEQGLARSMPPWGAVKGFGDLSPDSGLTQEEILILAAWVVGGAPQGDAALLPLNQPALLSAPQEKLSDALLVLTRTVLKKPLRMAGIRPQPEEWVESARITARLPDGRVEPLLWLYCYDPGWDRVFRFRKRIILPRGTTVEASRPLRYYLEILKAPSPES
jgi:hypothetical protein